MNITKKTLMALTLATLINSTSFALPSVVSDVISSFAGKVAEVLLDELTAALDNSEIKINNTTIKNDQQLLESWIVASNTGIQIKGNKINIQNSELFNDVNLRNSYLVFSNAGIKLNSKTITLNNAHLYNSVKAANSKIIGSNVGIEIGK